eukprot:jgi/Hompol1/2943/HPOL_006242-RA
MLRISKAKTAAGKRALKAKEPVISEGAKTAVLMKSTSASLISSEALVELHALKKPDAIMLSKRNEIRPFEDPKQLEFLSQKNDAALFVIAANSKKRPHTLTFARMFDYQLLDMIEVGVTNMALIEEFKSVKAAIGNRPLILFSGEAWEANDELRTAKSILFDYFMGDKSSNQIDLRGLTHIVTLTASLLPGEPMGKIYIRTYTPILKKSGVKLPRVELEDAGPHFDFVLRRARVADPEVMKYATKKKKEKNVTKNSFGERTGRIWLDKQDMSKMQTRKMKGLKRKATEPAGEDGDDDNEE